MSKRASIDGDIGRVEYVYMKEDSLLPIMVPVSVIELWVYGRLGLELNDFSDISNYTLVPILGIRYFDRFSANMYKLGNQASSLAGALSMIRAKREDYTIWTRGLDREIERRNLKSYIVRYFDEPIDQQSLFTLLHRKNKQYIPDLEKAYLATSNDGQCFVK